MYRQPVDGCSWPPVAEVTMEVVRKRWIAGARWSVLVRAVACVAAWAFLSLFVPLAHADPVYYHLEDASIGLAGVSYSVVGMNNSGVVVGQYAIVPDQPWIRAYASFYAGPYRDLDLLFNGTFGVGVGPTGETVYGVDAEGRVYGNAFARSSLNELSADFVTPGTGGSQYDLAPSGTF